MRKLSYLLFLPVAALLVFSGPAQSSNGIDSIPGTDLPISGGGVVGLTVGGGGGLAAGNVMFSKAVGIGVAAPQATLDVRGSLLATGAAALGSLTTGSASVSGIAVTGVATVSGALEVGSVASNGWGTANIIANGFFYTKSWDAVYASIDALTGKMYQLIGTYHGWDPNAIYIAGYNATNSVGGSSVTSISFGGHGAALPGYAGGPTMTVDLTTHSVAVSGTIKSSTRSNIYTVSGNTLAQYHGGCSITSGFGSSATLMQCQSACNRWCAAQGYSGGAITEWDASPSVNVGMCLCSP